MEPKCRVCDMKAWCVGWFYAWNCPPGVKTTDEFYFCDEHCDHDCCWLVEEEPPAGPETSRSRIDGPSQ